MGHYEWERQHEFGQDAIKHLDRAFDRWYIINPAVVELQKLGIDRVFKARKTRALYTVEYRVDYMSIPTGQVYMELVVDSTPKRPGWLLSCLAQLTIFADLPKGQAYVVRTTDLKSLDGSAYPRAHQEGPKFSSSGYTVPLLGVIDKLAITTARFKPVTSYS